MGLSTKKQIIIDACDLISHYPEDERIFKEQLLIILETAKGMYKKELLSNCCGERPEFPESDICSGCGEHAEIK